MRPRTTTLATTLLGLLALTACSTTAPATQESAASGFPVTVTNCGRDVEIPSPPERVVLLESAPVTILDGLGVMDKVIARAGTFPDAYYDDEVAAEISALPALSDDLDASGHLQISQEVVVAQSPDLVLGLPDGLTREGMADAGAAVLVDEQMCSESAGAGPATFNAVYDQVNRLGAVFGVKSEADKLNADLKSRVDAIAEQPAPTEVKTAAVLYPSTGGGPLYAYGTGSMAEPQLDALGVDNVFADTDERVFEVQPEELVARNPDAIIVLHQNSNASSMIDAVASLPGAETITAVKNDKVTAQLFNFTEPASPLTVTGLENLSKVLRDS